MTEKNAEMKALESTEAREVAPPKPDPSWLRGDHDAAIRAAEKQCPMHGSRCPNLGNLSPYKRKPRSLVAEAFGIGLDNKSKTQ